MIKNRGKDMYEMMKTMAGNVTLTTREELMLQMMDTFQEDIDRMTDTISVSVKEMMTGGRGVREFAKGLGVRTIDIMLWLEDQGFAERVRKASGGQAYWFLTRTGMEELSGEMVVYESRNLGAFGGTLCFTEKSDEYFKPFVEEMVEQFKHIKNYNNIPINKMTDTAFEVRMERYEEIVDGLIRG